MGVENLYLFPPKVVYPIGVLKGVLIDSSSALPGVVQMGEESTEGLPLSSHATTTSAFNTFR